MAVDLQNNNFELVRASWTAMDQTYGTVNNGGWHICYCCGPNFDRRGNVWRL